MRAKHTEKAQETHAMSAKDMREIVQRMGFNLKELSLITSIPYRTLQDYYYGARSIPGCVADQLRQEYKKEIQARNEVYAGITAAAEKVPLIIAPREEI